MPACGTTTTCDFSSASPAVLGKEHRLSDRQTGLCMNSAVIGALLNVLCEPVSVLHGSSRDAMR